MRLIACNCLQTVLQMTHVPRHVAAVVQCLQQWKA
jgi:hypothetical protein